MILQSSIAIAEENTKTNTVLLDKTVQYTTLPGMRNTESITFERINTRKVVDKTVKWYVDNLSKFIHSDARQMLNLVEKSHRSIDSLERELEKPTNKVSKSIDAALKSYINIEKTVNLFLNSGNKIINNQDKILIESESVITEIKNLEKVFKSDQKILTHNIKKSTGRKKEKIQKYFDDWKKTSDDTILKIKAIDNNLKKLESYMKEVKKLTRTFLVTLITHVPEEVRMSYENVLITLRAEQTCPCYKKLNSSRISLDALSKILNQEIKKINTRIPEIYQQVVKISEKMGYRKKRVKETSIWIELTESVNSYNEKWNSTAQSLEKWNKDIWLDSLSKKGILVLDSELKANEWDSINNISLSKEKTLSKGIKLEYYDSREHEEILMRSVDDNKIYSLLLHDSLTILTRSQELGLE